MSLRRSKSTHCIDRKDLLSRFQAAYDKAQALLDSPFAPWDHLATTIPLCECLTADIGLDDYYEMHQKAFAYFTSIVVALREPNRCSSEDLDVAFNIARVCEKAIPRIYACLVLACVMPVLDRVPDVLSWVCSIRNPCTAS
jgi:hypothetical protein